MPSIKGHKKPKIYADEDVFPRTVEFLRSEKINVFSVVENKLTGRDDRFHFNQAIQGQYLLLTLDVDFINHRRFPLRRNWGVIILAVTPPVTPTRTNRLLEKFIHIIKMNNRDYFRAKKFKVTSDGFTVWESDKSGKITTERFKW